MNTIVSNSRTAPVVADLRSAVSASAFASLDSDAKVGHLAATGFGLGGTVGALLGAAAVGIAAMTTDLVLPGTALYVAGPLSAMLLGAGAGAANGGLAGALIGWGIPVELSGKESIKPVKRMAQDVRNLLCPHAE